MNKHALGFAVSASMMILATNAMAHVGNQHDGVVEIRPIVGGAAIQAKIKAAIERPDVRAAVGEAFQVILDKYGQDGESIVDRVRIAQRSDYDFTSSPGSGDPNVACHSATTCHSACHGSRGWR